MSPNLFLSRAAFISHHDLVLTIGSVHSPPHPILKIPNKISCSGQSTGENDVSFPKPVNHISNTMYSVLSFSKETNTPGHSVDSGRQLLTAFPHVKHIKLCSIHPMESAHLLSEIQVVFYFFRQAVYGKIYRYSEFYSAFRQYVVFSPLSLVSYSNVLQRHIRINII